MSRTSPELDDFLAWHRTYTVRATGRPPAPRTLVSVGDRVQSVMHHTGHETPLLLATVLSDRAQVEELLDTLYARMSPASVSSCVTALQHLARYAQAKGVLREAKFRKGDGGLRNPPKPIVVYSADELEVLRTAALGVSFRFQALITFLADTGRRVGEALSLEWDWLRLAEDPPYFELPVQKNGRPQYIPLGARLQEVFSEDGRLRLKAEACRAERDAGAYPFPWTYSCAKGMFQRLCAKTGVEYRGFHNLRHTRATNWLAKGVPIHAVSTLLGHSSVATTEKVYSHVTALSFARYVD